MASKADLKTGLNCVDELKSLRDIKSRDQEAIYDVIFGEEFVGEMESVNSFSEKTMSIEEWEELTVYSDCDQ